jgi:hypothetical protein
MKLGILSFSPEAKSAIRKSLAFGMVYWWFRKSLTDLLSQIHEMGYSTFGSEVKANWCSLIYVLCATNPFSERVDSSLCYGGHDTLKSVLTE